MFQSSKRLLTTSTLKHLSKNSVTNLVTNTTTKRSGFATTTSSSSGEFIKIVDVSPRDGLQNEKNPVPTETKLSLIEKLTEANVPCIESTAFVSPKWVPQMADAKQVMKQVLAKYSNNGKDYPVLVPNVQGLQRILDDESLQGIKEIAIFGAASESFSMKNTNVSIKKGLEKLKEVADLAHKNGIKVRGYLSTVIACPYDGPTDASKVADLAQVYLNEIGCYELSLGDTIGVGTPKTIEEMLQKVLQKNGGDARKFAIHAHDTYGQGVANVLRAVEMGIRVVDSSVGGLGGCPYAKGATGNVATEDVVYALHGLGYKTGINLEQLALIGDWISSTIKRPNASRAGKAISAKL